MASAIYILDLKGKMLISRDYKGDTPHSVMEKFVKRVVKEDEELSVLPPVFQESGYTFFHTMHSNLRCTLHTIF